MIRLIAAAEIGAEAWQNVWNGFITEADTMAGPVYPPSDRRGYAAWRKGYEEARERTLREHDALRTA